MTKELTQMHDMNVFCPVKAESLTYDKKKKALSLLMFLKEIFCKGNASGGWKSRGTKV